MFNVGRRFIVACVLAAVIGGALAVVKTRAQAPGVKVSDPASVLLIVNRDSNDIAFMDIKSRKIVGMRVKSAQGKDLGEIDQLIVDRSEGKITHVVVGKGGLLGVGEQKVVLNWSDLKIQPDPDNRDRMVAMVDQAKVDSAPRYEARRDAPAASPRTPSSTGQPRQDRR